MTTEGRGLTPWDRLRGRIDRLNDLVTAIKLMEWDQAVLMPPKGGPARARASATLESMAHDEMTAPEVGELLDELAGDESLEQWQAATVRIMKRDYDKAMKVPPELVHELAEVRGHAYQAWTQARPADDFDTLRPYLEKLIDLRKQEADAVGWEGERYDALLDDFEPGMTTADVSKMFSDLAAGLKPLAEEILEAAGHKPAFLDATYEVEQQTKFSEWLVEQLGFDYEGGRLDTSPHPFTTGLAPGDVRQTTRHEPNQLMMSIYGSIHETGHALYEQGMPEQYQGLPVGHPPSLGLHESQSRMWENQVGRSRGFTAFMLPHLKDLFPSELGNVSPDEFYVGANFPKRSLIRVSADEVTYNLHLIMRFELELAMFRDELDVADLPDAWKAKSEEHVGIRPPNDADGVLQDMHWSIGVQGYFPTYTLGTLYSAAFFKKAEEELGPLHEDFARGDGSGLHQWLRDNVYVHAYLYPAKEIGEKILGGPLTVEPFLDYLRTKYGEIFELSG